MANVAPPGLATFVYPASVLVSGVPTIVMLPANAYRLFTYDAGTSTPRLTWSNSAESTPNANPIILDSNGQAQIFYRGNYRLELRQPVALGGAVIWSVDNFNVPDPTSSSSIQFANGSAASPSVRFAQATSSGLYSPAPNQVAMSISGVQAMLWAAGNVGIGGTPTTKLDVFGTTRLQGATTITTGGLTVTTGGVTVATGGVAISTGGLTVSGGGAAVTGNFSVDGNLTVSGSARRIGADFSAAVATRALFQTTTANSNTALTAIPSGTGTVGAFEAYGGSDPANASYLQLVQESGVEARINSSKAGTGVTVPIRLKIDNVTALEVSTNRNLTVPAPVSGVGVTVGGGGVAVTGNSTVAGNLTVSAGILSSRGFTDNATTAQWNITTAGYLVNNSNSQPGFAARKTAGQSTAGNVTFPDTAFTGGFNVGSMFDTGTGVATIPTGGGGRWMVCAMCAVDNTSGGTANPGLALRVNGADQLRATFAYSTGTGMTYAWSAILALSDTNTVTIRYDAAITSTVLAGSHFSMYKLG